MDQVKLSRWIRELIDKDELWRFYKCREWKQLKQDILQEHHHECYECRKAGRVTRYDVDADGNKTLLSTVHHENHVRDHPELALSRTYRDPVTGETKLNLFPVCKVCHNKLHPEKRYKKKKKTDGFVNKERW